MAIQTYKLGSSSLNRHLERILPSLELGKIGPVVSACLSPIKQSESEIARVRVLDALLDETGKRSSSLDLTVIQNVYFIAVQLFYGSCEPAAAHGLLLKSLCRIFTIKYSKKEISGNRRIHFFQEIEKILRINKSKERRKYFEGIIIKQIAFSSKELSTDKLYDNFIILSSLLFVKPGESYSNQTHREKFELFETRLLFKLLPSLRNGVKALQLLFVFCEDKSELKFTNEQAEKLAHLLLRSDIPLSFAIEALIRMEVWGIISPEGYRLCFSYLLKKAASLNTITVDEARVLSKLMTKPKLGLDLVELWSENRQAIDAICKKHRINPRALLEKVVLKHTIQNFLKKMPFTDKHLCRIFTLMSTPKPEMDCLEFGKTNRQLIASLFKNLFILENVLKLYDNPVEGGHAASKYLGRSERLMQSIVKQYGVEVLQPLFYSNWIRALVAEIKDLPVSIRCLKKNVEFDTLCDNPYSLLKKVQHLPFNRLKGELLSTLLYVYRKLDLESKQKIISEIKKVRSFRIDSRDDDEPILRLSRDRIHIVCFPRGSMKILESIPL